MDTIAKRHDVPQPHSIHDTWIARARPAAPHLMRQHTLPGLRRKETCGRAGWRERGAALGDVAFVDDDM